jgi:tetratricopeptide (TPR) repeat protein
VAAGVVALLSLLWLAPADNATRAPLASPPAGAALSARPDWLRAVPPAVVLHTPDVPVGADSGQQPFADAFTAAIAPWQAGNYAEAALRLDELADTYPGIAAAHFYRGAAWLLAGVPDEAVLHLSRSVSLTPPLLSGEARWYLGLALLESGQRAAALHAFSAGCEAGHAEACRAVAYLSPPLTSP